MVYVDSMDPENFFPPIEVVEVLDWWLDSMFGQQGGLVENFRDFPAGQQTGSHSCGVAVITTMAHVSMGWEPWIVFRWTSVELVCSLSFGFWAFRTSGRYITYLL